MRAHLAYLWYVLRHKWYVFVECYRLGIPWLGIIHDLSKFLPSEFIPYARNFYGGPFPTDEQADEQERRAMRIAQCSYRPRSRGDVERAFDVAWLHHQKRNRHHWQYWLLVQDDEEDKILPVPDKYRREMLADWVGAGKAITGEDNTANWYAEHESKMQLHPDTRKWIEEQLL